MIEAAPQASNDTSTAVVNEDQKLKAEQQKSDTQEAEAFDAGDTGADTKTSGVTAAAATDAAASTDATAATTTTDDGAATTAGGKATSTVDDKDKATAIALVAGMSDDEVKTVLKEAQRLGSIEAAIKQEFQKIYGKLGEVNSKLVTAKKKFTKDSFKKLGEVYGDEIAEALAADLGEVFAGAGALSEEEQAAALRQVSDSVLGEVSKKAQVQYDAMQYAMQKELMSVLDEDWDVKMNSNEFGQWLGTLPKDEAMEVMTISSARAFVKKLKKFDEYLAKQKSKAEAEAQRKQAESSKSRRLESNIQPAGGPGSSKKQVMTEEDAFNTA